ncbi:uncharacterized protein LOC125646981 [Ostrea edulis]|uniref:uncharacterized protein LOC125646981 n=1 Tax=Ostrea edulis TaxID=37623 RepID=UPI0024AEA329|nr:uncharacterized protein LOC125646981 [Ostrea edulis]
MVRCLLLFYGRVWWTSVIIAFSTRSVTTDYFSCPKGWVRFLDRCYLFSKVRATWASSSYLCAEFGGTLAHLETKRESDFLENVVFNKAYVGCINDKSDRLLDGDFHYSRGMTNQKCLQKCRQNYYTFSGTQYYGQCFCGNVTWTSVQNYGSSPENDCRLPCYGDKQDWCGGHWKLSVYLTGVSTKTSCHFCISIVDKVHFGYV